MFIVEVEEEGVKEKKINALKTEYAIKKKEKKTVKIFLRTI